MTRDTRIALFLMGALVAAIRAKDPVCLKCRLSGGVQDLGEPVVVEPLLACLDSSLTVRSRTGWWVATEGEHLTRR